MSPADEVAPWATRGVPIWSAGLLGIILIGAVDYVSGVELRVFPLYYAPISLVAWYRGRSAALLLALLAAGSWVVVNLLAGLRFSHPAVWVANSLVQAASFAIVGFLIATLRVSLIRERALSRIDSLTSLLNTRAFYEDSGPILARCRRTKRPVTLAYIDLDNFKAVNDTLGHQAGDDLLRSVGGVLRTSLRPSDLSARLGGDEFAVLLPEVSPRDATAILERVQALLAAVMNPPDVLTSTIGAVTFMTAPDSVADMVQEADARMYEAKTAGKNRICLAIAARPGVE